MGKKSAPTPPAAPDPVITIGAQTEANEGAARLAAQLNRVNQTDAFGSRTYTNDGDTWTQTDTIDPRIAERLYGEVGLGTRVLGLAGDRLDSALAATANPFDMSEAPTARDIDMSGAPQLGDGAGVRDQVYQTMLDRLAPEFAKDRQSLDAKLAAQGLTQGSEAYRGEQDDLTTAQGKTRLDAYLAAGTEADRVSSTDRANRAAKLAEEQALTGDTRQKRLDVLAEQETTRGRPIAELAQLLSLAGGAPQSNFQGFGRENLQPADALGAYSLQQDARNTAYQGELAQWQQGQQMIGNAIGSLPLFFL